MVPNLKCELKFNLWCKRLCPVSTECLIDRIMVLLENVILGGLHALRIIAGFTSLIVLHVYEEIMQMMAKAVGVENLRLRSPKSVLPATVSFQMHIYIYIWTGKKGIS